MSEKAFRAGRSETLFLSFRDKLFGQWDPKNQRPEIWNLYNGRLNPGENMRVFPLSNWTEMDVWEYIRREKLEVPSIYFSHKRQCVRRGGQWLPVQFAAAAKAARRSQGTRRSGCAPSGDIISTGCVGITQPPPSMTSMPEIAAACVTEQARFARRRQIVRSRHGRPQESRLFLKPPISRPLIAQFPKHHPWSPHLHPPLSEPFPWLRPPVLPAPLPVDILRFNTCGSVDDGKSTLIGRLLYDSKSLMEDQIEALERSADITGGGQINLANLTDGLRAEREQVKSQSTSPIATLRRPKRKFIIDGRPPATFNTRATHGYNTGASNANASSFSWTHVSRLIEQSRRHTAIASLLRIPHLIVAINKMDLVGWSEAASN